MSDESKEVILAYCEISLTKLCPKLYKAKTNSFIAMSKSANLSDLR